MSEETMNRLAEFSAKWGIKAWRISGDSEPLLNKKINALIFAGHCDGIDMGLITNGVFLDRVTGSSLRRLTYLGVSLDAASPETWSRLKRSSPENYHKIINNVRLAREMAPHLDISLKFIRWNPQTDSHKQDFGDNHLPLLNNDPVQDTSNYRDADLLPGLAESLGVRSIIKDAYPADMHQSYKFERCNATPLGGVFDASHKFHLCCDARNRYVLTDDYTRDDWRELPRVWGSDAHWQLIESIVPQKCTGCAKFGMNEVLEKLVMDPAQDVQINFI